MNERVIINDLSGSLRKQGDAISDALEQTECEANGFDTVLMIARKVRAKGRVYFVGNGGSAAIASHMAVDWFNKGKFASMCFNNAAAISCIGNDYGFRYVFDFQMMRHARPGDLLFAISSSGRSASILEPAKNAARIMDVVTLSGFEPDNALRKLGKVNFYVPSNHYGTVEISHLAILHALIDELAK